MRHETQRQRDRETQRKETYDLRHETQRHRETQRDNET